MTTSHTASIEIGKQEAERFIKEEKIDYDPFIAISDLHLVRKTVPISFDSFKTTISGLDPDLWSAIEQSLSVQSETSEEPVDLDGYAEGFAEGVAAVWEKIRDQVL